MDEKENMYYYLDDDSHQIGPISAEELVKMVLVGSISDKSFVRKADAAQWSTFLYLLSSTTQTCE